MTCSRSSFIWCGELCALPAGLSVITLACNLVHLVVLNNLVWLMYVLDICLISYCDLPYCRGSRSLQCVEGKHLAFVGMGGICPCYASPYTES
ncbi:hypothetical protein M404DRAFT_864986 [Pisolithus tinctorius Marx 270]|uniref:Uncharacterized protein n=1 Tax=Pisolithus tinctorius Marx 270 TaxID=870435 RepID=A0A0C3JK85_PISTI|nr:hypothetical protein M404DRAFT_864986 [Pisolithus tinctorius Marx 270]